MAKSYGGKLGVWLTKKRKNKAPSSRQSSKKAAGSFLPTAFATKFQKKKRNTNKKNIEELVGWDEVKCRPIFYRQGGSEQDIDTFPHEHNEADTSFNTAKTESDDSSISDHERDVVSSVDWMHQTEMESQSVNAAHKRGNRKQSYGGLQSKKRMLSDMSRSVLENVASPKRKSVHLAKSTSLAKQNMRENDGDDTFDKASSVKHLLEKKEMSNRTKGSFDKGYTPPQPNKSVLELDSQIQDLELSLDESSSESTCAFDFNSSKTGTAEDEAVMKKSSKKRKIRVSEKEETELTKTVINDENVQKHPLRQPSANTSLQDAKAYYDYLDATQSLTVE